MTKTVKMILLDFGHDISLTMPKNPKMEDVLYAFSLLGGMLHHGFVRCEGDKERFGEMIDACIEKVKNEDFTEISREIKKAVLFEKEVSEA